MTASKTNIIQWILLTLIGILLTMSIYLLYINFNSLKIQRIVKQETMTGKLKSTSDYVISQYPSIPNITVVAEPVAVQKARYLINEKKYKEARRIILNDKSSPFDGRGEYFVAVTFLKEKKYDSAIYYSKKCYELKPNFYNNLTILASSYENTGKTQLSLKLWENYLIKNKGHKQAWRVAATLNNRLGNLEKAEKYIDSAKTIFPKDSVINKYYLDIKRKSKFLPYQEEYSDAFKDFKNKKYSQAYNKYSALIKKEPELYNAYQYRAFCNYYLKNYKECISDITFLEKEPKYTLKPNLINLKGVAYFNLKQKGNACDYFLRAKNLGDKDGINNYKKFCNK